MFNTFPWVYVWLIVTEGTHQARNTPLVPHHSDRSSWLELCLGRKYNLSELQTISWQLYPRSSNFRAHSHMIGSRCYNYSDIVLVVDGMQWETKTWTILKQELLGNVFLLGDRFSDFLKRCQSAKYINLSCTFNKYCTFLWGSLGPIEHDTLKSSGRRRIHRFWLGGAIERLNGMKSTNEHLREEENHLILIKRAEFT